DVYHTYLTLRGRVNRTQFLDELKDKLIAKMDKDDSK
ncbi:MAG: tetracycline regulation of excision, RteC, partial [Bacteroides sp.]|nr:tetracycline regulation of excision, RteC [Bacteroides sp.]